MADPKTPARNTKPKPAKETPRKSGQAGPDYLTVYRVDPRTGRLAPLPAGTPDRTGGGSVQPGPAPKNAPQP